MESGAIIGARFQIEGLAGAGGMSEVHRARDLKTGAPVAVKLLQERDPGDFERFRREARVLAQLQHPGVVRYVAQGLDPQPYLVMEWLQGHDLAAELHARPRMEIDACLALLDRAAEALASVHALGIVHRDLKPANLFLVGGRVEGVKVIDFGISRRSRASIRLTATNATVGTPGYMAPEQVREPLLVDARADVFSLGCVIFECLAGAAPFSAKQPLALLAKLLLEDAPRIGELRADVPPALDDLLDRMLRKDAARRPADARAVLDELGAMDPAAPAAPRRPRLQSLTSVEQQLVSVLLVGGDEGYPVDPQRGTRPDPTLRSAGTEGPSTAGEAALAAAAERHEAAVDRLADGTLVVTFEAQGAATDQAARAARCALEVRSIFPSRPLSLAMGRGPGGRRRPIGALLDRAAGLLLGSRGALRIDGLTAGLLDRRFDVESSASGLWLRGERAAAPPARLLVGRVAPFVGRENELAQLQSLLQAPAPAARAVLVTGEPGMGKSRLCHELVRWAEARGAPLSMWIARGDPTRAGAPLGLLGELIRDAAQIFAGEPQGARREKLFGRVARHVGDEAGRVAELLGEIAGVHFPDRQSPELAAARLDPMRIGEQMRRAWVSFVRAECAAQPVLLVLEDLHWGDRATIDYLDLTLRQLKDEPLLVLALARPDLGDLFPDLWRGRPLTEIRLGGLPCRAGEELAREVLGPVSPAAARVLWERSDGNPFLLEELLRARAEGREDDTPETALAMVQSRLEGVSSETRRVLRAASVFGPIFWRGALGALLGEGASPVEIDARLAELARREWIVARPDGRFQGEDEYAFLHDLMRDAAYETLTEEDRRLGHALAGEWLELSGETDALALAAHFERGGELVRASALYFEAAALALRGSDVDGAVARATRGLDLGAEGPLREELLGTLVQAHVWRNEWAAAAAPAGELFHLAAPGSRGYCVAVLAKLSAAILGGQIESFTEVIGPIADVEPAPGAGATLVNALANAIFTLHFAGAHEVAARYLGRLHEVAGPIAHDPEVAGWVSFAQSFRARLGDLDFCASRRLTRAAQRCFEQADDRLLTRWCRTWIANDCWLLGDHTAALELSQWRPEGEERASSLVVAVGRMTLANTLADVGRLAEARTEADALILAEEGPDRSPYFQGLGRTILADVLRRVGDLDAAEAQAIRAADLLAGFPPYRALASARLSAVRLDRGDVAGALSAARAALEPVTATPIHGDVAIRLALARALDAAGERAAALSTLHAARAEVARRAARIDEPAARATFLARVPDNAQVMDLWSAWSGS